MLALSAFEAMSSLLQLEVAPLESENAADFSRRS